MIFVIFFEKPPPRYQQWTANREKNFQTFDWLTFDVDWCGMLFSIKIVHVITFPHQCSLIGSLISPHLDPHLDSSLFLYYGHIRTSDWCRMEMLYASTKIAGFPKYSRGASLDFDLLKATTVYISYGLNTISRRQSFFFLSPFYCGLWLTVYCILKTL